MSEDGHVVPLVSDLPDEVQVVIYRHLSSSTLGRLGSVSVAMSKWISGTGAACLWSAHCSASGIEVPSCVAAKTLFVRQARTLCTECRTPTRYTHVLLGCRLCEACERAFPHKFGVPVLGLQPRTSRRLLSSPFSSPVAHQSRARVPLCAACDPVAAHL